MDLAVAADLINAAAVTIGVVFAATQIHDYRRRRRSDAMLELVRSFQSPSFAQALHRINSLPDGADRQTIRDKLGADGEDAVFLVGLTWESMGVLVFRGEITIELVQAFYGGLLTLSWRKLAAFVEDDREFVRSDSAWEWFQWLAERMTERDARAGRIPAHVAHREWQP